MTKMRLRSRSPHRQNPKYSPASPNRQNVRHLRGRRLDLKTEQSPTKSNNTLYTKQEYERLTQKPRFQNPSVVIRMKADNFTRQYVNDTGLRKPLLFTNELEALGMKLPKFDYEDLRKQIPNDHYTEVFNQSKERQTKMKVKTVLDEMEKPIDCPTRRGPYTTCIEFSYLPLGNYVQPPFIARELTWASHVFPIDKFKHRGYSIVEKYLLLQMAGSFVDFHIELTGTTTWYHVQRGFQYYFIIPPTDENIQKLKEWRLTNYVGTKSKFFGDLVKHCTCVRVDAGQTLIMPSGWIHGIYVPVDCLVYAGNFLHEYSIDMQLKVFEYEENAEIGDQYGYEHYTQTLWYYVAKVIKNATNRNYVRLIHSTHQKEMKKETSSNSHNCFDLVVEPPEYYDKITDNQEPTQYVFDSIDTPENYVPPNDNDYNEKYIRDTRLVVRFFWRRLLVLLNRKLKDLPNAKVAEGIRRPHHLLLDLENLVRHLVVKSNEVKPERIIEMPDYRNESIPNNSALMENEPLPSTSGFTPNSAEPLHLSRSPSFSPASNELSQQMWELREQGHYDFTLKTEKSEIGLSKYVFMTKSENFKQRVLDNPNVASAQVDCSTTAMYAFVRWLYFEQVDELDQNVDDLFSLAAIYNIEKLKNVCIQHMKTTFNDRNFPTRLITAFTNNNEQLKQASLDYAKKMSQPTLCRILSCSPAWSSFTCANEQLSGEISELIFTH